MGSCWQEPVSPAHYSSPPRGLLSLLQGLLTPHCSDRTKSPLCPQWRTWAVAEMTDRLACSKASWPSRPHRIPPLLFQTTTGPCIPSAGQEVEEEAVTSEWRSGKNQGSCTPLLLSQPSSESRAGDLDCNPPCQNFLKAYIVLASEKQSHFCGKQGILRSQVQWHFPVIKAAQEPEAGGSPEPRGSRITWAT